MSDPKAVLAEYDMPVPDGMDVKVVENADNCVHITMPAGARADTMTFQMKNSVPLRGGPCSDALAWHKYLYSYELARLDGSNPMH